MKTASIMKTTLLLLAATLSLPAQAANVVVEYIHTDHLGTPIAVTDESGNVIERFEYEPYGLQVSGPVEDGPGYTGHVEDAATGLTYMQQRYYDPGIGMFLSVDPVTAYDSPVVQFNRYRYANGNPYLFTDPTGMLGDGAFSLSNFMSAEQSPSPTSDTAAVSEMIVDGAQSAGSAAAQTIEDGATAVGNAATAVAACAGSHGCRQQALNTGAAAANTVAVGGLVAGQPEVTVVAGGVGKASSGAAYVDKLVSGTATASDHVGVAIDAVAFPGAKAAVSQFGEAGGEALKVIETVKDAVISTKDALDAYNK